MSAVYAGAMVRRAPTPPELFVDGRGRPYFLWDVEMTLESYREHLRSDDPAERAYWLARALRDAKPDDVLELVSWEEIAAAWGRVRELVEAARAVVRLGGGSYWRLTRALAPFDEEGT